MISNMTKHPYTLVFIWVQLHFKSEMSQQLFVGLPSKLGTDMSPQDELQLL